MKKTDFNRIVNIGINRGKEYLVVKILTDGNPAPEIIINRSVNFKAKTNYYNKAYNADIELIKTKKSGKRVRIEDVLLTSNLNDLSWFAY